MRIDDTCRWGCSAVECRLMHVQVKAHQLFDSLSHYRRVNAHYPQPLGQRLYHGSPQALAPGRG